MYRKAAVVTIVVLLLSLAFASVSFAQSGTTANTNNTKSQSSSNQGQGLGPGNAFRALGPGGMRNLRANEQQWYSFEYAGDNSPIQIQLDVSNVQFSVWTLQDLSSSGGNFGASANPVARSTSNAQFAGKQFWQGSFNTPGTYYIMVENANGGQGGSYTLQVTGTGVSWKGQSNQADSSTALSSNSRTTASTSKSTVAASNSKSAVAASTSKSATAASTSKSTTAASTSKSATAASTSKSTATARAKAPVTLPRTGGEMASVIPMLIGGMGALSVAAGALLRRRK